MKSFNSSKKVKQFAAVTVLVLALLAVVTMLRWQTQTTPQSVPHILAGTPASPTSVSVRQWDATLTTLHSASSADTSVATLVALDGQPTATSGPSTLPEFVQASNGIAEVKVTHVFTEGAIVEVQSWLKVISVQPEEDAPKTVNPAFLEISTGSQLPQPFEIGGYYILFLGWGSSGDLCRAMGNYWPIEGTKGIYKIDDGKITGAGLSGYTGMPVPQFEGLLQQSPLAGQAQPTVIPDSGKDDLVEISHSSNLIVEATLLFDSAGTGSGFYNGTVEKVLQQS